MKWIKATEGLPPKGDKKIAIKIWGENEGAVRPDFFSPVNKIPLRAYEWLDESEDELEASIRNIEIELWQNKNISEDQYDKALPHINCLLEICKVTPNTENNQL